MDDASNPPPKVHDEAAEKLKVANEKIAKMIAADDAKAEADKEEKEAAVKAAESDSQGPKLTAIAEAKFDQEKAAAEVRDAEKKEKEDDGVA